MRSGDAAVFVLYVYIPHPIEHLHHVEKEVEEGEKEEGEKEEVEKEGEKEEEIRHYLRYRRKE
jgi:hypothetical protein